MRSYWCRKESPPVPTFSQTGVLRPVPLRGRPSSFRKPARSRFLFANGRTYSLLPQPCTSSRPPFFSEASCVRSPLDPSWQTSGYRAAPGSSQPKAIKKACGITTGLSSFSGRLLQAIARTPSPWRLPGSRLCKRHAAPAEKRPALPPGTGPSAVCSCCPGPPAGGCRRH